MADRSNQPAVLRRKIERLEALLAAEKEAHTKTFDHYRNTLYELVELRVRHKRAVAAMQGEIDG